MAAAVATCNGPPDPRVAQAAKAPRPVAVRDAAAGAPPPAVMDARPVDAVEPDAAAAGAAIPGGALRSAPEVEAFHGDVPVLPLLSPDGKIAAVDVSEGLGPSLFHTYEVELLGVGGRLIDRITVVDQALAEALRADEHRPQGAPPMKLPTQRLARAAAKITERLAGFTPFAKDFDADAIGRAGDFLELGGASLTLQSDPSTLVLGFMGSAVSPHVERIPARRRQGGRCGGPPRLAGVWWDPPRGRALLQIIFPGSGACEDEPTLWLVW